MNQEQKSLIPVFRDFWPQFPKVIAREETEHETVSRPRKFSYIL